MSWSISYTANDSNVIKDACHLVLLTVDISELDNEDTIMKFCRLSMSYFLHLSIVVSSDINNSNSTAFNSRIKALEGLHKKCQGDDANTKKMYYSLQITQPSEQTIDTLLTVDFNFNLWIIHSKGNKQKFLNNIIEVHEHLSLFPERRNITHLGTGSITTHDDVDWILQRLPPNIVEIIQLASIDYPNIFARTIELIHSFGYAAIVILNQVELNKILATDQICQIAQEKYKTSGDVLIARCILQLGAAISFPLSLDEEYLHSVLSRLAHPFLHRKAYVSAFKVISMLLNSEDMSLFIEMSDVLEGSEDATWLKLSNSVSTPRNLLYS